MDIIKGTGVALVTPFNEDFSIDFKSLENIINNVINGGVDFLVVLGTTGESVVLNKYERREVIDFCIRINNNRLPIVLGLGSNNTLDLIKEIKLTNFSGIDAILSVSPYYNKPTQDGIYLHYSMIAEVSPVPIIIYNVPGRTATNITSDTTIRLANDFKNIIAIKEASGDLKQIEQIIKYRPKDFLVLSGDDELTLKIIELGGDGVIAVIGQAYPEIFSNMVSQIIKGNIKRAIEFHKSLVLIYPPLYNDGNPAGIKASLNIMGICKNVVRPPLVPVSESVYNKLKEIILGSS
jgi:4-hydroxy-tetrahydrodipicolinate synthase